MLMSSLSSRSTDTPPLPSRLFTGRSHTSISSPTDSRGSHRVGVVQEDDDAAANSPVSQNERFSCARCAPRTVPRSTPRSMPRSVSRSVLRSAPRSAASSASGLGDVCRICQSSTGALVHPCICDGSMGGIHERCLTQWYEHSGNNRCEICLTEYARSARVLRPLREWRWPDITPRLVLKLIALGCLFVSLYKVGIVIVERRTFERMYIHNTSPRSHDHARGLIFAILILSAVAVVGALVMDAINYFRKQFVVRFTEHEKHQNTALTEQQQEAKKRRLKMLN